MVGGPIHRGSVEFYLLAIINNKKSRANQRRAVAKTVYFKGIFIIVIIIDF